MKILALDLGKYKTVGCEYESESGAHRFKRDFTTPAALQKMVQEVNPDRVVIEVCSMQRGHRDVSNLQTTPTSLHSLTKRASVAASDVSS